MNQDKALSYEDVIARVSGDEFFSLFERLRAEPRWVTSNGKPSIQLLGLCHGGSHHSALFDPTTCKVHCFSECGCGMYLHTWVGKVTEEFVPEMVRDNIKDYFTDDDHPLNLTAREPKEGVELGYTERPFTRETIDVVPGILPEYLDQIKAKLRFDSSAETLEKTSWHQSDGIDVDILQEFDVACRPAENVRIEVINGEEKQVCDRMGTIILPHHNIRGEIVGIYERSFDTLRREAKQMYGEWMTYSQIASFPRAKYVPLLKLPEHMGEDGKTSYSFPNSFNLYGLHKAASAIKETGCAIIFEGAKSVMLAHQWGRKYGIRLMETAVASHTFGAHVNHINMILDVMRECPPGVEKKIYLAFDKQYQVEEGEEWSLYDRKTRELAEKVYRWSVENHDADGAGVEMYRLKDIDGNLKYKDAPVDEGFDAFKRILDRPQALAGPDAEPLRTFNVQLPECDAVIGRIDGMNGYKIGYEAMMKIKSTKFIVYPGVQQTIAETQGW